jgi:hypothetical protein
MFWYKICRHCAYSYNQSKVYVWYIKVLIGTKTNLDIGRSGFSVVI